MSGVPPLLASTFVAATPEQVWDVLKDQRNTRRWSPEVLYQVFFPRRLSHQQISLNLNRRKAFVWPTVSRYVDVARPHRLAFVVLGPGARWSYALQPEGEGTRLTLRRDLAGGRRTLVSRVVATLALGGIEEHDHELLAGMESTLGAIAREAGARNR